MKTLPLLSAAALLALAAPLTRAAELFRVDQPGLDAPPTVGMVVFQPKNAEALATVEIVKDRPAAGAGCLLVDCPSNGYVSVSFPVLAEHAEGRVEFMLRGEVANAAEVFVGVQHFTMEGGFKTVSATPLVFAKEIGAQWRKFSFPVKRDPAATRWQLTFAVRGPGRVWIDELGSAQ